MTEENLSALSVMFLVLGAFGFTVHGWAVTFRTKEKSYPKTNITGWVMSGIGGVGLVSTLAIMAT